jgi:hypothetical protein
MNLQRVYRVTTFVPPDHLETLLRGITAEVPLRYGQYDQSAWWSAVGAEQFRPLPGAKPTCGKVGTIERLATIRVEFVIARDPEVLSRVIARGIRPHHPWQEPAVFIDEAEISVSHDAASSGLKLA